MTTTTLRAMRAEDADAIADLHATSWRSAYRGIFTDHYLDHEAHAERRDAWRTRLQASAPSADWGIVAENAAGSLVGFAYVQPAHDPTWGDYLDNLHVAPDLKGAGLGRLLMHAVAERLRHDGSAQPLYLWVLEANTAARRFYERLGAELTDRQLSDPLAGQQHLVWRCVWRGPSLQTLSAQGRNHAFR